jgi:predicted site-specific integrase-resolvase
MELTTSEAVQAYGVFPNVLHRMILMGRLQARKDANGRWLISKESLERWDRQRVRRAPKPEPAAVTVIA